MYQFTMTVAEPLQVYAVIKYEFMIKASVGLSLNF